MFLIIRVFNVHCRIGSLEKGVCNAVLLVAVHCRIGSLEIV